MTVKALGLLSGGLDSSLAVRFIKEQGIDVLAVNFASPFCTCTHKSSGCKSEAIRVAESFDVPIKTYFHGEEFLEIVRNPKHGYGSQLNPCLDCRIMMFRHAKKIMEEEGAQFIFTGEVLGQRPMSQRRDAMRVIDKEAGVDGLILRPLSAHHFPPTLAEEKGWVKREAMFAISGRSRKPLFELAEELDVHDYQCASGGCLLTEKHFAARMRDLLEHTEENNLKDAKLLRYGRHFRISDQCKVIVGRNEEENKKLGVLRGEQDLFLIPETIQGPSVVVQFHNKIINRKELHTAASFGAYYCKKKEGLHRITFTLLGKREDAPQQITAERAEEETLRKMIL